MRGQLLFLCAGKTFKGNLHAVKSALPLLEIPARYAAVHGRCRKAGTGAQEGSWLSEGSEVGDLLMRLVESHEGTDCIRALTMMGVEATRRYMLREGSLPPSSPDVAGSKNALAVLSAWRGLVEVKTPHPGSTPWLHASIPRASTVSCLE